MGITSLLNTFLELSFGDGKKLEIFYDVVFTARIVLSCIFCDLVVKHPMMNIWGHKN